METQEMPESLVNLSDMQEIEEIQEDIVSIPKEVILISLVSQEQALYNPKHEHYRNTQRKDIKWLDIAENVGWSETQCKAKWKAMRDQYCRELKRSKFNAKANVKWKYFKELDFLRPYALSRNYRPRNSIVNANNANNSNNNTTNINNNHINSNNNNNNNNLTIHQNQTEATAPALINNISHNAQDDANDHEFPSIKIEAGQFNASDFVSEAGTTTTTTNIKNDHRLLASLTPEQLNIIQQQQDGSSWNYITTTTTATTTAAAAAAAALALSRTTEILIKTDSQSNGIGGSNGNSHNSNNNNNTNNSNNLINGNNLQTIVTAVTNASDEALYNSFVAQITQQQQQQHHVSTSTSANQLQLHQQQHLTPDEEDDDPIHTFLNIESYFEKELIAMIQQEDILYNNYHPNYRNVKMKLEVWDEIARKLKKTVKQCRLKWKALRDQYIREHKRLKNRENPETLPRWKHYDALSFLQKFIKHKSGETEKNLIEIPKAEIDIEMEEPCLQSPKLSPIHVSSDLQTNAHQHHLQQQSQQSAHLLQLQQTLPSLSGPHNLNNNNNSSNNSSSNQQVQTSLQQQQHHTLQQSSVHLQQHQHQQLLHSRHHHQQQHQDQQIHHHHDSAEDESLCAVACGDVSAYDEMDINDYIIGDGDDDRNEVGRGGGDGGDVAVVVNAATMDDDQELDDDDEDGDEGEEDGGEDEEEGEREAEEGDIDHKSQQFPTVYSPHVNSVGNSNDIDEEMPQHRLEFKPTHDVSLSQAQAPNSHSFSQQAIVLQQHYQQQQQQQQQNQQHIITLDNDENTQQQHHQHAHHQQQQQNHERDFRDHLQTSLFNGSITTSTTTTSGTSIGNETLHAAALSLGLGAGISVNQVARAAATTSGASTGAATGAAAGSAGSGGSSNSTAEDDEVGAFFKAVAMKIRNAKMSPIAFTDLQIDILRVINGTLRNH